MKVYTNAIAEHRTVYGSNAEFRGEQYNRREQGKQMFAYGRMLEYCFRPEELVLRDSARANKQKRHKIL